MGVQRLHVCSACLYAIRLSPSIPGSTPTLLCLNETDHKDPSDCLNNMFHISAHLVFESVLI